MASLDREITEVYSRYWERERQSARGKHVVLVEGDDDGDVMKTILTRRSPTWATRIHVVTAGGRSQVISLLKNVFKNACALVDRDIWTDEEAEQQQAPEERKLLFVTSGWCLENMFLNPKWLKQYNPQVAEVLAKQREKWVLAGALWWTLQRAREAQQQWQENLGWEYGVPHEGLDLTSRETLIKSIERRIPHNIREVAQLDLSGIGTRYEQRKADVSAMSEEDQWRVSVHGKQAFKKALLPALGAKLTPQAWRVELAQHIGMAEPLDSLVATLLP